MLCCIYLVLHDGGAVPELGAVVLVVSGSQGHDGAVGDVAKGDHLFNFFSNLFPSFHISKWEIEYIVTLNAQGSVLFDRQCVGSEEQRKAGEPVLTSSPGCSAEIYRQTHLFSPKKNL